MVLPAAVYILELKEGHVRENLDVWQPYFAATSVVATAVGRPNFTSVHLV